MQRRLSKYARPEQCCLLTAAIATMAEPKRKTANGKSGLSPAASSLNFSFLAQGGNSSSSCSGSLLVTPGKYSVHPAFRMTRADKCGAYLRFGCKPQGPATAADVLGKAIESFI